MDNAVPALGIDPLLLDLVAQACGVEQIGRRSTKSTLWVVEIHPAFERAACLMVVTTAQRRCASFATYVLIHDRLSREPRPAQNAAAFAPLMLPAAWEDPVAAALGNIEGWPAAQGAARDGIHYSLFAQSAGAHVTLWCSSPDIPALIALQGALLSVAGLLATHDHSGVIDHYVRNWVPYTRSSPPRPAKRPR